MTKLFAFKTDEMLDYIYISKHEILDRYFPIWKEQMIKLNEPNLISEENCIQDWITLNNAIELPNDY